MRAPTRALSIRHPRTLLITGLAAVVVAAAGFAGVYEAFFNGSSAAPLKLSSTGSTSSSAHSSLAVSKASGTWSITSGSVVGYRVREKLAFLPAKSDAVGRTSDVAGSMTVTQSGKTLTVAAASFVANLRTLKSDRVMRDQRIRTFALDSDQYPTASFKLTKSIALPASALSGQIVHATATGLLTIHATTRSVSIPLTARYQGGEIETVGSLTFPFTKFGMQPPNIGGFVSVENHATMEFDLHFRRGASTHNTALAQAISSTKPVSGQGGSGFGPPGGAPVGAGRPSKALTSCLRRHRVKLAAGRPGGANRQSAKLRAALKACGAPAPSGPGQAPPTSGSGQAP